ncbi:hypothetical protein [Actinoplanes subtropicus]|uniref:hypothetical protein n=1 Tax=Actinoplanes subtropicus TaxID=543632 RepID=UPI0004C3190E|nr:hypothetical protein [Actinoplanes subtropicus]
MSPVLADDGWQVETVEIDLGTGLREWIEVRGGDQRRYVATAAERDVVLREHGVDPAALAEVETIDDGCE